MYTKASYHIQQKSAIFSGGCIYAILFPILIRFDNLYFMMTTPFKFFFTLFIIILLGVGIAVYTKSKDNTDQVIPEVSFEELDESFVPIFTQNLQYGMENNDEIRKLQEFLIDHGYLNGEPNGHYYSYTEDAVLAFQLDAGIPQTGIVDTLTRQALHAKIQEIGYIFENENEAQACLGLAIAQPTTLENLSFPLEVSGFIHPTSNPQDWTVFEGEAGHVVIKDTQDNILAGPVIMTLSVDWMNGDPKPFSLVVPALSSIPAGMNAQLIFTDNNPAGPDEGQSHTCMLPITVAS